MKKICFKRLKLLRDIENLSENKEGHVTPEEVKKLAFKNKLYMTGFSNSPEYNKDFHNIS